ncbi:MAG: hypothetical protein WKF85_06910 [Chitinophagaceae bacterium]
MKSVKTGRKILLLIILLSPLALYLESCKKADTVTPPVVNNSTNTLPILTTTTVSSITATSAITGGNISSDGGLPILSRGVVWSTSSNPTIALSAKTIDGTGTGSFISNLSGLSPDTTYFARAYATTSLGTAYGNEVSFKFSSLSSIPNIWNQVGNKLVGSGAIGNALQGGSVAISADGNTLVFSGHADNGGSGAIWIFNRTNNVWNQVAKLVGSDAVGNSFQSSVAISADGKTVIVGGARDNYNTGAAWIFTLNNGIWAQQGSKLVGTGAVGKAHQGSSVSISGDGNTVVIGGAIDNGIEGNGFSDTEAVGAAWIFTRNNGIWAQQGSKLVGTGAVGKAAQGSSVSISGDGNTVVIGGNFDNMDITGRYAGAAWIFTRNNGIWSQQGDKLVGTGGGFANQGHSVSISGDGNTVVIGGFADNNNIGAAWIFTRNNGIWAQQGSKLVGSGANGNAQQGASVSISGDGNSLVIGGLTDNNGGAAWIFTRNNGIWAQQGSKLVGLGADGKAYQGVSVSINSDGTTVAVGGAIDNGYKGAVWIFNR